MLHGLSKFRISPAASHWMRLFMILPNEVQATGPKGFISKGDVLDHIQ